jgi:RNA polymerase-binding transcription factor DksA
MSDPMLYGEVVQELTHLRAQYEQFIIDRERERIIKLLETILVGNENGYKYCYECGEWGNLYSDAIALIKGENK